MLYNYDWGSPGHRVTGSGCFKAEPSEGLVIDMRRLRHLGIASSLVVMSVGIVTVHGLASKPEKSQDPRTWLVDGRLDESRIPHRVQMSTPWVDKGVVWIDPHSFYNFDGSLESGKPIPVFDSYEDGIQVGEFDLREGVLDIFGVNETPEAPATSQPYNDDEGVAK